MSNFMQNAPQSCLGGRVVSVTRDHINGALALWSHNWHIAWFHVFSMLPGRVSYVAKAKFFVILKVFPSEIYIDHLMEFRKMIYGENNSYCQQIFFLTEESTLFFAWLVLLSYQLVQNWHFTEDGEFPRCDIFETRSERRCSIFGLLRHDQLIPEGESEKFVFIENKNTFKGKIHSVSCLTKGYLSAKE